MDATDTLLRAAVGVAGALLAGGAVLTAVRTTVLPRGVPSRLTRVVFATMRQLFMLRLGSAASYARRDQVFASYAPLCLLTLLQVWLAGVLLGFAGLHWAADQHATLRHALAVSGSSVFTLGFVAPSGGPALAVTFAEASVGLVLIALLIAYLPAIYGSFSRREAMVARVQVRAGQPPSGGELVRRAWAIDRVDFLDQLWVDMEGWFIELQETHTSFPALVFFRSPQPDLSWVTTAGAVLDGAALMLSTVDQAPVAEPQLCLRAGFLALREVAGFHRLPFDPDPSPSDPVTISRAEYDDVVADLVGAGVPVRPDRDQAWRDFAGWRVNYDRVLVALAALTMAPYAPWSSDRSLV